MELFTRWKESLYLLYPQTILSVLKETFATMWRVLTTPQFYVYVLPLLAFKYAWRYFFIKAALLSPSSPTFSFLHLLINFLVGGLLTALVTFFIAFFASKQIEKQTNPHWLNTLMRSVRAFLAYLVLIVPVILVLQFVASFLTSIEAFKFLTLLPIKLIITFLEIPLSALFVLLILLYVEQPLMGSFASAIKALKIVVYNFIPFLFYMSFEILMFLARRVFFSRIIRGGISEIFTLFGICLIVALYMHITSKQRDVFFKEQKSL